MLCKLHLDWLLIMSPTKRHFCYTHLPSNILFTGWSHGTNIPIRFFHFNKNIIFNIMGWETMKTMIFKMNIRVISLFVWIHLTWTEWRNFIWYWTTIQSEILPPEIWYDLTSQTPSKWNMLIPLSISHDENICVQHAKYKYYLWWLSH